MLLILLVIILVLSLGWGAYGWPAHGPYVAFGPFFVLVLLILILFTVGAFR